MGKKDKFGLITRTDSAFSDALPSFFIWRSRVFSRDNYTCQCCSYDKGNIIEAHHILNYSEHVDLRVDIDNGITLCRECHVGFHKSFGYRNNNKEQLENYIKNNTKALITQ